MKTKIQSIKSIICSFNNVRPINTLEDGLLRGYFTDHSPFISNQTVRLTPAEGGKKIYVIRFGSDISKTEYLELFAVLGKRPVRNATNYLFGLMAEMPVGTMALKSFGRIIIAAAPDNLASVFTDEFGDSCFLCACQNEVGRWLNFADVICRQGWWSAGSSFLAEDL